MVTQTDNVTSNAGDSNINALTIDTSPMRLDGRVARVPVGYAWPLTGNDVPGNTGVRRPTAGTPTYNYTSDNPLIAKVTPDGKVEG